MIADFARDTYIFVDLSHQTNLSLTFSNVQLIDAKSVYPDILLRTRLPSYHEVLPQVFANVNRQSVDEYGRRGARGTPGV